MASAADCKKVLVDFIKQTPNVYHVRFDEDPQDFVKTLDVKNWKRWYKCRSGKGEYEFDEYVIHQNGCSFNRWGDPRPRNIRPASDFVWERAFDCEPFDGQFAFVVLEDKDGKLYVGDYIGD